MEDIAKDAQDYHEHKGRNSINVAEGPEYGLDYEDDIIFWWGLSAPAAGKIIENSLELQKKCSLEPKLIFNEGKFVDALRHFAKMHGYSNLREYCRDEKALTYTLGPVLETVNTYTYRTPYYQLSGAQDHHKGMVGLQEQIWQATLEKEAVVSTNSPSKLKGGAEPKTSDQMFTGGWMPRATFYKNVGIIQYDRRAYYEEFDIVVGGEKGDWKYTHAYFPKWAFDRVEQHENRSGTWVLGKKEDSYLALYSNNPVTWESNYELRADGFENVWIVELGCADDNGSFEQFQSDIVNAYVEVTESSPADYDMYGDNDIYRVKYESPSLGTVEVSWDGCFEVDDKEIHLGPYPRFQNKYCYQKFGTRTDETGTSKTIIEYGSQSLELDFDNATRKYGNK